MNHFINRIYRLENPPRYFHHNPKIEPLWNKVLATVGNEEHAVLLDFYDAIVEQANKDRQRAFRSGFHAGASVAHELLTFGKAGNRKN